ncbi:hypothetical protein SKDZ_15G4010 [Saccharomyces kudriavzevii ZP591]|nr:hypothetical protein SKDZ_15G4010 [Saccharomyces kudriavzevii ZP591]
MPKKVLGDKIERNVDAIRPPSLTLVLDDLKHLPVIPQDFADDDDGEDKVLTNGYGEKKISRKFGGTIALRKRLESVPELFLHDFKKKPCSKLDVIKEKNHKHSPVSKAATNHQVNGLRSQETKRVGSFPIQRKSLRGSKLPRIKVPRPSEHVERLDHIIDRAFVPQPAPIVMPVHTRTAMNPVSVMQDQTQDRHMKNKYGKSDSEILFDEIVSAYENVPTRNSTALNSEIDRIIDLCSSKYVAKKMETFQTPQIVCPYDTETLFSSATPKAKTVSTNALNDTISSPEYSTSGGSMYSERWSSEDELPELESTAGRAHKGAMVSSIVSDGTNGEDYFTAVETLSSTVSVEDLDIHDALPKPSSKSPCSVLQNGLSVRKLEKITLNPPNIMHIMTSDDESENDDDGEYRTFRILQEKIDRIDIASCSSSIYSS